jgi:putative transposase
VAAGGNPRNLGRGDGLWMSQVARNVTDSVDGLLMGKRYLIHDRDPLFTDDFLRTMKGAGVESVKLPARSPNLNAHAERFVRSINESCLERLILLGESSLRTAVQNFVAHYHSERNHQGLGNRLILPDPDIAAASAVFSVASDCAER